MPLTTPVEVFSTERFDSSSTSPDMEWNLPVTAGSPVQVRVYFANSASSTQSIGSRRFTVQLDGTTRLSNYDIIADVGHRRGTMKAFDIVSDGNIDLDFRRVTNNPLVNAIEVVTTPVAGSNTSLQRRGFDGAAATSPGAVPDTSVDWSSSRGSFLLGGSLYTAKANGTLERRGFDGAHLGAPTVVDLHGLTAFSTEMRSMTSLFYDDGRMYFTRAGQNALYMRYFTQESDMVGAQVFTLSTGLSDLAWSNVRGAFLADGSMYWVHKDTGLLQRTTWTAGAAASGTTVTLSGPGLDGTDWRAQSMFAATATQNVPPSAVIDRSCTGLSCRFDATRSSDSDGAVVAYSWDLGDGTASAQPITTHAYAAAGTYTVTLTVTDDRGATSQATLEVTVADLLSPIEFVASATDPQTASTKLHNVVVPPQAQAGDALVLAITTNSGTQTVAAPAGWSAGPERHDGVDDDDDLAAGGRGGRSGNHRHRHDQRLRQGPARHAGVPGNARLRAGRRVGPRGRDRRPGSAHDPDRRRDGARLVGGAAVGRQVRRQRHVDSSRGAAGAHPRRGTDRVGTRHRSGDGPGRAGSDRAGRWVRRRGRHEQQERHDGNTRSGPRAVSTVDKVATQSAEGSITTMSSRHDGSVAPRAATPRTGVHGVARRVRSGVRSRRRRLVVGGRRGATRMVEGASQTLRRLPLPPSLRRQGHDALSWRPGRREVALDRLLLGLQNRTPADEYAEFIGDLRWPSTPVGSGPHADLLRAAEQQELTDEEVLASRYADMARDCIRLRGFFFSAVDDAGILAAAREYIDRHLGRAQGEVPGPHQSAADSPVRVAPISGSDCYQILDGHHRVASALVKGQTSVSVQVRWLPVRTPLQQMLEQMSWTAGERQLYQPVDSPELTAWVPVRRCTDRLEKMRRLLEERPLLKDGRPSYLDVASCYRWFPAQLQEIGFDAAGIERDERGGLIASTAYGLDPEQITIGDAVDFLRDAEDGWDVVSCFSLLHHFVLGRAKVGAEELVRLLDSRTRAVLFLDTGQDNEAWFNESLAGWDPAHVAAFLREHTTFDEIIDLGPDEDAVPPYENQYRRHLFACVRRDAVAVAAGD